MKSQFPQFKTHSAQAIKSFVWLFIVLVLVLLVFYLSLNSIFSEYFLINVHSKDQFQVYFIFFSAASLLIFLAAGVGVYRKVFLPIPQVLRRIQDIKNYQKENESEDYFASLPDFWNLIEEEVIAVAKAVGRRQKQSDRIRKAIEQILNVFPESTLVVDQDNRINYSNQAFKKIFLPNMRSDTSDVFLHDIFREPQILSLIQDEYTSETLNKEIAIIPKSSETKKHFVVFKTPFAMKSDDRSREQMVIFHDITTAKKTDQMKTDFVSNVSHELRTPVMSIQGYVQTLKEDIKSKKFDSVDKFFEIIESQVERLTYLLNDLLELSSLESDVNFEKTKLDPKTLTQKILKQFSLDLEKGNYIAEEIYNTHELTGEERLIEQVLINLVQNSLRYTPSKTKITIEWNKIGNQTVLKYKDNGPGISEEHLDRIFERFYRIDPHRSRARGGTGLGLSIVKHIMQKHGGSVEVHSTLGHGLEFNCTFPA
jgi:two-component system phosphate regulon sensor histidine kinase PhoR